MQIILDGFWSEYHTLPGISIATSTKRKVLNNGIIELYVHKKNNK